MTFSPPSLRRAPPAFAPAGLSASIVLVVVLVFLVAAAPVTAETPKPRLEPYYDDWLLSVDHLLTAAERAAFHELDDDVVREVFIRRFWDARPGGDGAALRALWRDSFDQVRERYPGFAGDRARVWLAAGKPDSMDAVEACRGVLRPLRIWTYGKRPGRERLRTVFIFDEGAGADPYRLWNPSSGVAPLVYRSTAPWTSEQLVDWTAANGCFRSIEETDLFRRAVDGALDRRQLYLRLAPASPPRAWLADFRAELERVADPAVLLPASLSRIDYLGRYQTRTIVRGRVAVPVSEVRRNADGRLFDRLVIEGDVRYGGTRLVDAFRVVHHVVGAPPDASVLELDFYRRLRFGTYRLDLRLEDSGGRGLLRITREIEVPRLEEPAAPPAGHRLGYPGLTRDDVALLTTLPSVELLAPAEEPLVGDVEIEATTTGGPIDRVDLWLDGELAASDSEPPWAGVVGLGDLPEPHLVDAVARDSAGRELARDRLELNIHGQRFAVRLVAPRAGGPLEVIRAEVDLPADRELDRVELFLDNRHLATRRRAPFVLRLSEPPESGEPSRFVRAVAYLDDGSSLEDVIFLDTRHPVEEIDVRLVELSTSVTDEHGRFVTGLASEDFRVAEDGEPQEIVRFGTVADRSINVALLMDVSASMRRRVHMAAESARRFLETVLRPTDQASLLTFNHDIRRVVPFTSDLDRLLRGAGGFRAWGTTRLHDSLIYTLCSFGGLEGRRALVLLSDGQDVDSDFEFKQVLDVARRSGVAVYPIVLGVEDPETLAHLRDLALETGGRYFEIREVQELARVYARIEEELRSQYLLVYRSPNREGPREFRRVEVEILRPDLKARSPRGYYP